MIRIKRGNKGELHNEWIIVAVILIIGLIALLYFLVRLNIQGLGPEVACKLSILAKASAPNLIPTLAPSIPIECVTKKICLGKTCNGAGSNFQGEKEIINQALPEIDPKLSLQEQDKRINESRKIIEKTVADEFYNCWNKFGRGKLDLFGSLSQSVVAIDYAKPRCVICSRMALDKDVNEQVLSGLDVYGYLSKNKPAGSNVNYLKTLELEGDPELQLRPIQASTLGDSEYNARKTNELAVVFMQTSAPSAGSSTFTILGAQALAYTGAKFIPMSGFVLKPLMTLKGGVWTLIVESILITWQERRAYDSRQIASLYCGTYNQGGNTGCTLVQIMPYDRDSINSLCEIVEAEV